VRRYLPSALLLISGLFVSYLLGTPNPTRLGTHGHAVHVTAANPLGVAGSYHPASFAYGNSLDWIVIFLLVSFAVLLTLTMIVRHHKPQVQPLRLWMTLVPILITLDILSKGIVVRVLPYKHIYWSSLIGQPLEIIGVALCTLVLMGAAWRRRAHTNAIFCALILAGALADLISGFTYHGYIPDFLVIHSPTTLFNLADIMVFLGIVGALTDHLIRLSKGVSLAKGSS